jgi:hypothetical protein
MPKPCCHQPRSQTLLFTLTGRIMEQSVDTQDLRSIEVAHLHKHIILLREILPQTNTNTVSTQEYKWRDLP